MVLGSFRVIAVFATVGVALPACFFPEAIKETATGTTGNTSTTAAGGMGDGASGSGAAGGGAAGGGGAGATGGGSSGCATITASGDTYLSDNDPTGTHGESTSVLADSDDGQLDKADVGLFAFAPGTGGAVTSATVTLYSSGDVSPDGFSLHLVLEPWEEADASWLSRVAATPWKASGCGTPASCGDALTTVFQIIETDGAANEIALPAAVVQQWIDEPSSNFGVALKHSIGDHNGVGVYSRESADHAPTLTYCVD